MTVLIYLNPELEKITKPNKLGELRLFLADKIVDVVPHIGRVVIFKSEKIEHEVKPTLGYERFAVTVWFNHVVQQATSIPKTVDTQPTIFVGIPAYRDSQLIYTLQSLVSEAEKPNMLRIAVFIQHNMESEDDAKQYEAVIAYIESEKESGVEFRIEAVDFKEAKNAYYARHRLQKHFKGETYQLQIDSHMRLVKNWDTKMINYLNMCETQEKAVLTCYPRPFKMLDTVKDYRDVKCNEGPCVAMCFNEFSKLDGLPRFKSRNVSKKFERPFECLFYAAGFNFSYGRVIEECGYTDEVDNLFFGEELFQMQKLFTKGYSMYTPPENLIYHLWERNYRPTFAQDNQGDKEVG